MDTKPAKKVSRLPLLLDFLQKEKVGNSILLTSELGNRAASAIGVSKYEKVYDMVRILEKRGHLTRVKNRHGKGITLNFDVPDAAKSVKPVKLEKSPEKPSENPIKKEREVAPVSSPKSGLTMSELLLQLQQEEKELSGRLTKNRNKQRTLRRLMKETR